MTKLCLGQERFNKMSDEELFKLAIDNKLYSEYELYTIARILNIKHSKYNVDDNIEQKIVFDLFSRMLNKKIYSINEVDNKKISEKQFNKAIFDISQNSIYFKNENEYYPLFFNNKYNPFIIHDEKYYLNTIKSIFELYGITLKKKTTRINKKINILYSIIIDSTIKDIVEYKHGIQKELPKSMQEYKSLFE